MAIAWGSCGRKRGCWREVVGVRNSDNEGIFIVVPPPKENRRVGRVGRALQH